jgi:hypothetical protein
MMRLLSFTEAVRGNLTVHILCEVDAVQTSTGDSQPALALLDQVGVDRVQVRFNVVLKLF